MDPKLLRAMQLQQYSAQYLLSCHCLLQSKERVVRTALHTFASEEQLLDLKIAKLRSGCCLAPLTIIMFTTSQGARESPSA